MLTLYPPPCEGGQGDVPFAWISQRYSCPMEHPPAPFTRGRQAFVSTSILFPNFI